MRHLPFTAALLLAACQPAPFETTPAKDPSVDVTPPGNPPSVDHENDGTAKKTGAPLRGPFASLEAICGGETPRCTASAPVAVAGGGAVLAVATFQSGPSETGLAIQTAKGWFIDREPGEGPMWSHHSPHSTWFDFDRISVKPDGFSVFVTRGESSFIGGMGNRGSSRHVAVVMRTCRVRGAGVVCEDSAPLYEQSCQTPMEEGPEVCKESGKKP